MTISDLRQHAGEDFEAKVVFVPKPVGSPLDDPNLGVEPFDEAQRDFLLGGAIGGDALPVSLHQGGEPLERLQALPSERLLPVVEEPPGPSFPTVVPQLSEGLLEQVSRMETLVGGQQFVEGLSPIQGEILSPRQQGIAMPLDERSVLARQPLVFGTAYLIERLAQMSHHVKLVEQNGSCGGVVRLFRRGCKRLPHVHNRDLDLSTLRWSHPGVEGIQACFRAVRPSKPDGASAEQVTHHDSVGMPLADRYLIDPDDPRPRRASAPQLLLHVLLVQGFDGVPIQPQLAGNGFDTGRATPSSHIEGKSFGVERVVGEEGQRFPFHLLAHSAQDPSDRHLQVHSRVAAGEIADEAPLLVVEGPVGSATDPAHCFFPRRSSRRIRAWESPKTPLTLVAGRNSGNR